MILPARFYKKEYSSDKSIFILIGIWIYYKLYRVFYAIKRIFKNKENDDKI
jgi:hypothetical protein